MMEYIPNKWKMVKMTNKENGRIHYRIFGAWSGGYAHGDSWKMNSGVTSVVDHENYYAFHGSSGSVYICSKRSYGNTVYGEGILQYIIKTAEDVVVEEMPEDTNFMELNYE